jgi:hypothetical protein
MSKVQTTPREELRQGIKELWAASKIGTQLDKRKAIKKIKYAVQREERIMLNKIQVEEVDEMNLYGKDPEDVVEALEIAEALTAEGEKVALPEQLRAKELWAAGKSYSAIAREIFGGVQIGSFHINKVKKLIGEVGTRASETTNVEGLESPQKKRSYSRRGVQPLGVTEQKPEQRSQRTPQGDGGGHPLAALDDGHTNGNGHVDLSPTQFSKLWQIVTGGQVGFRVEAGQVTCWVSESSFKKALPVLLDQLKA